MRPLIGITTGEIHNSRYPWSPVTYGQSHTYSDAVIRADGAPCLIPICENADALRSLYVRLDGILLAGGNDIDPSLYHEELLPVTRSISPARDLAEIRLLEWAVADGKPILAICRGMQLINVFSGGTLYQDLAAQVPAAENHELSTTMEDLTHMAHQLRIAPGSRLADVLGTEVIGANSHHHQAIKDLAPTLKAVAWAEDDTIEAIELAIPGAYLLGVQCHPESLDGYAVTAWQRLFSSFVDASSGK